MVAHLDAPRTSRSSLIPRAVAGALLGTTIGLLGLEFNEIRTSSESYAIISKYQCSLTCLGYTVFSADSEGGFAPYASSGLFLVIALAMAALVTAVSILARKVGQGRYEGRTQGAWSGTALVLLGANAALLWCGRGLAPSDLPTAFLGRDGEIVPTSELARYRNVVHANGSPGRLLIEWRLWRRDRGKILYIVDFDNGSRIVCEVVRSSRLLKGWTLHRTYKPIVWVVVFNETGSPVTEITFTGEWSYRSTYPTGRLGLVDELVFDEGKTLPASLHWTCGGREYTESVEVAGFDRGHHYLAGGDILVAILRPDGEASFRLESKHRRTRMEKEGRSE